MIIQIQGDFNIRLVNPRAFNQRGQRSVVYFTFCSACDVDLNYYQTPPLADQGPTFQAYCPCGAIRTFRRLTEKIPRR